MRHLLPPTALATTLAALVALSLGLTACASFSTEPEAPMTDAEKAARADELFTIMDVNGDGYLTKEEMSGGLKYISQTDGPATRDIVYGLKKKAPSKGKEKEGGRKVKHLTEDEIRQLVEQSFKTQDNEAISRISKEDFKKIVIDRSTSSTSSTGAPSTPAPSWDQVL